MTPRELSQPKCHLLPRHLSYNAAARNLFLRYFATSSLKKHPRRPYASSVCHARQHPHGSVASTGQPTLVNIRQHNHHKLNHWKQNRRIERAIQIPADNDHRAPKLCTRRTMVDSRCAERSHHQVPPADRRPVDDTLEPPPPSK